MQAIGCQDVVLFALPNAQTNKQTNNMSKQNKDVGMGLTIRGVKKGEWEVASSAGDGGRRGRLLSRYNRSIAREVFHNTEKHSHSRPNDKN